MYLSKTVTRRRTITTVASLAFMGMPSFFTIASDPHPLCHNDVKLPSSELQSEAIINALLSIGDFKLSAPVF